MRRALHCIVLLLPALVPKNVSGVSHARPNTGTALNLRDVEPVLLPYLAVLGAPPLRFQDAPPPPDLTVRPAAGAPPIPNAASAEAPAPASTAPVETKSPASSPNPTVAASAPIDSTNPAPADKSAPAPAKAPPASILPDDARPAIRPEDFLPYFQIPGAKPGDVNLLVPPSALRGGTGTIPVPPSSATYTQSKE